MFLSYVSEASPGLQVRTGCADACERCGPRTAGVAAAQQHRSTRLIAHTEYYYTLCAITATARRPIFSLSLLCRLDFHFGLLARLISAKNRWILPKSIKESVDLPDFVKESVTQIQILYTFQAGFEKARS